MTRVLLVEDHPADVLLLRELLEIAELSWSLKDVPTFAQAVQCWQTGQFEVLLLDLDLPDGLGLELLARALELTSGAPVVVLSGLENREMAAQSVQLGARGYVVKGLEAAEHLGQIVESSTAAHT
ncbi:response regulator [Deinococcus saxicola]|uniref:response regulator n=1 Tax=Deinococcus saxicola TaxID=249406 RepID=UPI0039F0433F